MRGNLIETYKIINRISNYGRLSFSISPQTGNLLSKQILKTINLLNFFVDRLIYF